MMSVRSNCMAGSSEQDVTCTQAKRDAVNNYLLLHTHCTPASSIATSAIEAALERRTVTCAMLEPSQLRLKIQARLSLSRAPHRPAHLAGLLGIYPEVCGELHGRLDALGDVHKGAI